LAVFEEAIADLATTTARKAAGRGAGSLMVFPSVNPYTSQTVISVLNMIWYANKVPLKAVVLIIVQSDTRILYNQITNLRLAANGHNYCPGSIEMIQMVHYRNLSESREWLFNETADVVFYLPPEKGHVSSLDDVVRLHLTSE
jgi:hypothetical protein